MSKAKEIAKQKWQTAYSKGYLQGFKDGKERSLDSMEYDLNKFFSEEEPTETNKHDVHHILNKIQDDNTAIIQKVLDYKKSLYELYVRFDKLKIAFRKLECEHDVLKKNYDSVTAEVNILQSEKR